MERETSGQRPRPNYGHPQLTDEMPGLAINPEDARDCRQLRVPTPGAELLVALGWISKRADARLRDVAAVGLIWVWVPETRPWSLTCRYADRC